MGSQLSSTIDVIKLLKQELLELELAEDLAEIFEEKFSLGAIFERANDDAEEELTALSIFASDIAANINDSFADLIFNGMKGNFDSLGDLWENTLDTMLQSFSQFAATIISNPIRIALNSVLIVTGKN